MKELMCKYGEFIANGEGCNNWWLRVLRLILAVPSMVVVVVVFIVYFLSCCLINPFYYILTGESFLDKIGF